jgi:hypothetical protein
MKIIFVAIFLLVSFNALSSEIDCRTSLKQAICLVNAPVKESDRYKPNRSCLVGGERYEDQILEAYDAFPNFVQAALCTVKFLYIETNFFGSAWSAPIDESNPQDMMIGLRQHELDSKLKLESFLSWYEQLSFGGLKDFTPLPYLPSINITPQKWVQSTYLIDTLLHEVGHLLDYKNFYNQIKCDSQNHCSHVPGSWGDISWQTDSLPKEEFDFPERKLICINNCTTTYLDPSRASEFYLNLHENGFISQLAAIHPMEDFAESFKYYVLEKYMGIKNTWDDKLGHIYNSADIINSKSFENKKIYLDNILKK